MAMQRAAVKRKQIRLEFLEKLLHMVYAGNWVSHYPGYQNAQ
jgi:hypothetical protein